MEVAGLAIGVVSIVGLLSTGLDVLEKVDAARNYSKSTGVLRTRLGNQKLQFQQWAETNSFGTARYNPYLDRPDIRPRIEDTFDQIWLLLGQSDKLSSRYEGNVLVMPFASSIQANADSESRFVTLKNRITADQKAASIWKVSKWAIKDEKRLTGIVENLARFVEDLYNMSGTSRDRRVEVQAHTNQNGVHEDVLSRMSSMRIEEIEPGNDTQYDRRKKHLTAAKSPEAICPPPEDEEDLYSASPPKQRSQPISSRKSEKSESSHSYKNTPQPIGVKSLASAKTPKEITLPEEADDEDLYSASPPMNGIHVKSLVPAFKVANKTVSEDEEAVENTPVPSMNEPPQDPFRPLHDPPDPILTKISSIFEANSAAIQEAERFTTWQLSRSSNPSPTTTTTPSEPSKRVAMEARDNEKARHAAEQPSTYWQMLTSDTSRIIGTIAGPPDTPWAGGYFHVMIDLPPQYPFRDPRCHFMTKILHPDIEPVFGRITGNDPESIAFHLSQWNWSPAMKITTVLEHFVKNLREPKWDGIAVGTSLDLHISVRSPERRGFDRIAFEKMAREWTEKYASGYLLLPGSRYDGFCNTTSDPLTREADGRN